MEDRLRICIVSYKFSPFIGGAEVRAEKQARQLQAFGHDVTVVTLRLDKKWARTEVINGLEVVRVGGVYGPGGQLRLGKFAHVPLDIAMFLTLWRLRHSYDVIHAFQITTLAAAAVLVGQLTHKPVVISTQNTGPDRIVEREVALMADTLTETDFLKVDFNDWVITTSDVTGLQHVPLGGGAILKFLQKSQAFYQVLSTRGLASLSTSGFREGQIMHISGSVDTEKFRPAPEKRPDPTRPERDILCVARLEYAKGIDVLLHAWGRMMHSRTEKSMSLKPRLLLVGEGKAKPQLIRIVAELGIQESVKFLGRRNNVVDLLQQAWGFVLPSRWEGMPNALLEAMACELPCVATQVSGSEDIVIDGINGLLVEPEQPVVLAQALRCIIEDTYLAQHLGQQGRATVVRKYQLPRIVQQCVDLYRVLLSREASGDHRPPDRVQGVPERNTPAKNLR